MAELVGADIERLRTLASSFGEKAEAVHSMERRVTAACGELERFWFGADAEDFLDRWQSNHRPQLLAVAAGLVEASKQLTVDADEQQATSSVGADRSTGGTGIGNGGTGVGNGDGNGAGTDLTGAGNGNGGIGNGDGVGNGIGAGAGVGTGGAGGRGRGGESFGIGFGLPVLGEGWDLVTEFASDRWDEATSAVDAVADETAHRFSEFVQYGRAYTDRWLDNPIQSVFDELTLTAPFERLVGAGSILVLGGEYQENIRNGEAEFITGLPISFNDAITLGHTVFVDDARPSGGLVEHEMQHVADVEDVGGVAFYSSYLGNWIGNIIEGQDPSLGGEAYENIWWEQRAHAAQDGNPPFDLDLGRFDPRNWFD